MFDAIVLLNLMFGLRDVLQDKQDSYFNIIVNNFLFHFYSNQENLNLKALKVGSAYKPVQLVHRKIWYICFLDCSDSKILPD